MPHSSLRGDQRNFHLCPVLTHRRSNLKTQKQFASPYLIGVRKDVEESITICPTRHCEEIKETFIYVRYFPIDEAI